MVRWQRTHGRHDLPWQNTRDPYRIWVSEIMLQQTQVSAVIGYYARFLKRFPDVYALAGAGEEEVMQHWAGLGYYSRARNLHKAARMVVGEWDGQFPESPERLVSLPGIGRSTAAAIVVFAFGQRVAILDGNVKRVFARCFGVHGYPGDKKVEDALWERACGLLPKSGIEAYTQGLMDLGATLCTRGKPACERCPLHDVCFARREGRQSELPHRKPAKPLPLRECVLVVVCHGRSVLVEKRPAPGIWGGLWCPPQFDELDQAAQWARTRKLDWCSHSVLEPIEHGFTHYHLTIRPVLLRADESVHRVRSAREAGAVEESWLRWESLGDAALPAPVKKLLVSVAA